MATINVTLWTGLRGSRGLQGYPGERFEGVIDASDYDSINDAVTAIGSDEKTLIVTDEQTLTASLTVPSNIHLWILKGGSIVKASSYTLTINGQFSAGMYQVFDSFDAGDVTFGDGVIDKDYSEWWGAVADDTTNCDVPIQSALDASLNVTFPAIGIYKITTPMQYRNGHVIKGRGHDNTIIKNYGDDNAFEKKTSGFCRLSIEDLQIYDGLGIGSRSAGHAIYMDNTGFGGGLFFKNMRIYGHYDGINGKECYISNLRNILITAPKNDGVSFSDFSTSITLQSVYANSCGRHGFYMKRVFYSTFISTGSDENVGCGYYFDAPINVSSITMISVGAKGNGGDGIYIAGGNNPVGITIMTPFLYNNGSDGIHINGAKDIVISGGEVTDNDGYYLNLEGGASNVLGIIAIGVLHGSNVTGEINDSTTGYGLTTLASNADAINTIARNIYPSVDDDFYLGKNSISTPLAYKGVILKDTTDGKYYRIECISGVVTATEIT